MTKDDALAALATVLLVLAILMYITAADKALGGEEPEASAANRSALEAAWTRWLELLAALGGTG